MIAKQSKLSKQPLPERIANAPVLRDNLWFYMQAFLDLQSERLQSAFGQGSIPWRAIVAYGTFYQLTLDEVNVLIGHVRALDSASQKWASERNG